MARARGSGLTSLIESDSEPDFDSFTTIDRAQVNATPRGGMRGRVASGRVTKPGRGRGGRRSAGSAAPTPAAEKVAKSAAAAKRNDTSIELQSTKPKRGRPKTTSKADQNSEDISVIHDEVLVKGRRGRPPKSKIDVIQEEITIQEDEVPIQDQTEDVEHVAMELDDEPVVDMPTISKSSVLRAPLRASSASALDLNTDAVTLRKRLGELERRYDSLQTRHEDLKDVAVKEAQHNYEALRKQVEKTNTVAEKLIAQLRAELSAQTKLAQQGQAIQQRLDVSEAKCQELNSKVAQLDHSLTLARAEVKTLSTKLTSRQNENNKVPGSALKNSSSGNNNAELLRISRLKEDLYGDLTGLLVRGLKHNEDHDEFDCIQTGKNGTLHFKLALDSLDSVGSYEDVQYTYLPQLDSDRDQDLLDILPDYLTEEINFKRPQASTFFTRVIKSLMNRVE